MRDVNPEKLWNIIKKIKYETAVDMNSISGAVTEIEHLLEIESSYLIFKNMTTNNLKIAAEMYLYLCTFREKSLSWSVFYKNLLQTDDVYQILLSLNRLMKGTRPKENKFKIIANKVFKKITNLLSLKYEEIEHLLPGRSTKLISSKNNTRILPMVQNIFCSEYLAFVSKCFSSDP